MTVIVQTSSVKPTEREINVTRVRPLPIYKDNVVHRVFKESVLTFYTPNGPSQSGYWIFVGETRVRQQETTKKKGSTSNMEFTETDIPTTDTVGPDSGRSCLSFSSKNGSPSRTCNPFGYEFGPEVFSMCLKGSCM